MASLSTNHQRPSARRRPISHEISNSNWSDHLQATAPSHTNLNRESFISGGKLPIMPSTTNTNCQQSHA